MSLLKSLSVIFTLSFTLILLSNFAEAEFSQSEISDILRLHNRARCSVTPAASVMPALTWDPLLAQVMQRYLDSCPGYAHNPQRSNWYSQIGGSGSVGENLAWGYETILDATDGWLSEGSLYTYAKLDVNGPSGCSTKSWADCGHFTQIIWSGTTRVGCARGSVPCSNLGGNANYAWGCNYASAGNVVGAFPYVSSTTQGTTEACQPGTSSTPCPSNLASVATVSYSSAKPFVVQQLYDSDNTTGWVPVTNNANEQLKFDFGKLITISQIQVDFPKPDKIPQSLALKLKLADGTVSTVGVWSNNKGDKAFRSKTFNPPIQASIVRFVVQTPGSLVTKIGEVRITGEITGGC